jgi:hypothetical protein
MKLTEIKGQVQIKNKYIKKERSIIKHKEVGIDKELIRNYFKGIKYRGVYFITLKQEACIQLKDAGHTYEQIADLLNMHHSSAQYLYKHRKEDSQCFEVKYQWKELINKKLYPVTVCYSRYDKINFSYFQYIEVVYVDRLELNKYISIN